MPGQRKRDSNIEVLRLLSMFMVLALHANYASLGEPAPEEAARSPLPAFTRILAEQLCIVAVNVFVMISGWFGIRPTLKGMANILFQVCFYSIAITAAYPVLTGESLPLSAVFDSLYLGSCYWFIPAYLVLYVLSKPLNAFVVSATAKELGAFCLCYFTLELLYGLPVDSGGFAKGYSALSFIGLYVLARYLRKHGRILTGFRPATCFLAYLCVTLSCSAVIFALRLCGLHTSLGMQAYLSPTAVFCAACLLLGFTRLDIDSPTANRLATSCLAIYLIHAHPLATPYYTLAMKRLYDTFNGPLCLLAMGSSLAAIGLACLLADRIRLAAWNAICRAARLRQGKMTDAPPAENRDK